MSPYKVVDNPEQNRFEVETASGKATANYHLRDGVINFTSTEVPYDERGKGIASQLARAALDAARARRLRVIPTCPYMAAFIQRHNEYDDLLEK